MVVSKIITNFASDFKKQLNNHCLIYYTIMNFSSYQNDIFNFLLSNNNSLCINAVAGSGKTTTIVEGAKRIASANKGKEIIFLAFNNSIVGELSTRFAENPNINCSTLHSHGFKSFQNAHLHAKLDKFKWTNYINNNIDGLSSVISSSDVEKYAFARNTKTLLDLARINLCQHGDVEKIEKIAEHHNIELIADEADVVDNLLIEAYDIKENMLIDFTDMVVLPCMNKKLQKFVNKYDVVFIDEAQDLSMAQQKLMQLSVKDNGRFVAVGDPMQAINGFCGAMNDSFSHLAELANNELPLSVNYRCGKQMINLAQEIVPTITAHDGAIDGVVEHKKDLNDAMGGDMIICRKSAPLVDLCLKFIASGKSANIKGKDIAEGLKNLIKKMKVKNNNITLLFERLDAELEKTKKSCIKLGVPQDAVEQCGSVVTMQDKIKCLQIIAETCTKISEVEKKLDNLFQDSISGRAITLSTIHKSKGLEADNVFLILPNKLPLTWKGQQSWEFEQEMHLKYVALTRAKKAYTIIDLDENGLKQLQIA